MERSALYIDPETRDLVLDEDGVMLTIYDDAATAQAVRLTVQVYKGEWPLDLSHGTDYDRVFVKPPPSDEDIAEVIREAAYQEGEVNRIEEVIIDRDGRSLGISLHGTLRNNNPLNVEVNAG